MAHLDIATDIATDIAPVPSRPLKAACKVCSPLVRNTDTPFESQLLTRIKLLETRIQQLALEMCVRVLLTRDMRRDFCGETLVDQYNEPLLSRSGVSRVTDALYAEHEQFATRDLSSLDVVYLFADGVYEAMRGYTQNQAV